MAGANDEAVQIVSIENDAVIFHEDRLCRILLHDDYKDLPVAVLSVAGPFRKGKSFLLNFFLKYLYAQDESGLEDVLWLPDNESEALKGFNWRAGAERDTTGYMNSRI